MNIVRIYVNTGSFFSPVWEELKGAIFPFGFAELLDERLDEAYITILGSNKDLFKPTTRLKVEVENGGTTHTYDFLVANDSAIEKPNGAGIWKHEIYAIEMTKALEGTIGQTIVFTNALGNTFATDTWVVY